ncbi:MAG: iron-sulfur cluster insertion protein ErpA [Alphaproteobacteria bacterium]|nr:iron-sulfur cluster insertion protein ErpA [Alphaproteobacteria bacterium]
MPDMNPASQPAHKIQISDAATSRIAAILSREAKPDLKLRIAVAGGGCSGFQYHFSFDSDVTADDQVFQRNVGQNMASVVVDETSLGLLAGSVIDFVEDMAGSSFQIKNPLAKSGCGCGNSFSL